MVCNNNASHEKGGGGWSDQRLGLMSEVRGPDYSDEGCWAVEYMSDGISDQEAKSW